MKMISVITGGSGGMGKAIARELGKDTAVVLAARNEQKLLAAQKELKELGYEVYTFQTDIQNEKQVQDLASYAASLGSIKNVIHTSGVSPTDTDADSILRINVLGTLYVTNAFYPLLAEGGTLINFASVAAYTMEPDSKWYEVYDSWNEEGFLGRLQEFLAASGDDPFFRAGFAYVLSKRFVIYYSQKNVLRFGKKKCRILSVSPGSYLTPMHQKLIDNQPDTAESQLDLIPAARWGHPYEIAALTAFLCSSGAGFISGVDILADGGQTANTFIEQLE